MRPLAVFAALLFGAAAVTAADPPITATLVAKKTSYAWPVGQTPAEFAASLKEAQKNLMAKKEAVIPDPLLVDFVLRFTNTGKEATEIFVGGDVNTLALELDGPGVVTLAPQRAFTLELRMPKAVKLEPGKSYDMPVGKLADGYRNDARLLFFTAPGEYALKATYELADAEGKKGVVVKTAPVKFKVEAPK